MSTAVHRFGIKLAGAALGLCMGTATGADGSYRIHYFKEARPLGLDSTRAAIQTAPAPHAATADLTRHGIAAADLAPTGLPGWADAVLPGQDWDAAATEAMVLDLADNPAVDFVSPVFIDHRGLPLRVTPEIYVRFREDTPQVRIVELLAQHIGGEIVTDSFGGMPGVYEVRSFAKDGFTVLDQANALAGLPEVEFAEPNQIMTGVAALTPNDPLYPQQWALNQANGVDINAPQAWDITTGSPSIQIVVLDTGVQQNHPDLNQVPGMDFITPGGGTGDPVGACDNHGTTVAGCITARINNGIGVVGVAPNCRTAAAYVFVVNPQTCGPDGSAPTGALVNALDWAMTIGARVTNTSLGLGPSSTLASKFQQTYEAGIVHFAASGNDGSLAIGYPAALPSVAAVGAIGQTGLRASFSNFGSQLEFVAPGVNIRTTDRTGFAGYGSGDYTTIQGTSFASPIAAGVAALMLSLDSSLTPDEVRFIMQQTAVDRGAAGFDQFYGYGQVNALAALQWVQNPPPVPGAFDLLLPAQEATAVSQTPLLVWENSPNALNYDVLVDDDAAFINPEISLNTVSTNVASPVTLEPGRTYFWKVTANNIVGGTPASPLIGSFRTISDCNNNGIDDPVEIANMSAADCNGNGLPDSCELAGGNYRFRSLEYSPIDFVSPQAIELTNLPPALGDVTIDFRALSDISISSEFFAIDLNGVDIGDVYTAPASDCQPNQPAQLVVPAATFNAARVNDAATLSIVPTSAVDTSICNAASWVYATITYAAGPLSEDGDMNGIPDACDNEPCVCADSNCDGVVSVGDIGFFVAAVTGGEAAWNAAFPGGAAPCDFLCANDISGDNLVTVSDIAPFVAAITGGGCP